MAAVAVTVAAVTMIMAVAVAIARLRCHRLCHPAADGLAATIISDDLIHGDDRSTPGGVADDACLAVAEVIRLGGGGGCKTKDSGRSDDREEYFHGREELLSVLSDVDLRLLFSPLEKIGSSAKSAGKRERGCRARARPLILLKIREVMPNGEYKAELRPPKRQSAAMSGGIITFG